MLAPNRSPELHCFFGSLAHVQKYQIEKIRHPEQGCFRDAFGRVHMNSAASQHAGAQRLHSFVAIDDEHVFRAHLRINRRLLGHGTPPSLLEAAFRKAGLPLRSGPSPERSKPRLLSLSRGGGDWSPPKRTRKPVCFRLLRERRFFARSSWPPQSFERQGYRRPLSPAPSALLDSFRGDRLPRLLSCPKD